MLCPVLSVCYTKLDVCLCSQLFNEELSHKLQLLAQEQEGDEEGITDDDSQELQFAES
jgi:hypothetical protein